MIAAFSLGVDSVELLALLFHFEIFGSIAIAFELWIVDLVAVLFPVPFRLKIPYISFLDCTDFV